MLQLVHARNALSRGRDISYLDESKREQTDDRYVASHGAVSRQICMGLYRDTGATREVGAYIHTTSRKGWL